MSTLTLGRSFASPWPYTFKLAEVGLMGGTKDRQTTDYRSYKPPDQGQVAPTDFGYGADNPAFGAVTSYGPMPLGMGLRAQRKTNAALDLQYDHALGVDCSVFPWVKGPDVTLFTPVTTDSTNGVVAFLKVASNFYAITGRYALGRASDSSWPVAQDFGAGKVSLDAVPFFSNAAASAHGFVAMGDADNFWYVTAAGAWAQHASLKARSFGLVGREFYRGHDTNKLAKVDRDADPLTAANWQNANAFDVGDQSSAIVRLPTTASGILLAVKTDGVYTLDAAGDDLKLHGFQATTNSGKAVARWGNELYVSFDLAGFWRFDAEGSSRAQVGPELLTDGSDVVGGVVTACAGVEGAAKALYGAFWNPDTSSAYLCKFLGMATVDGRPHPVWHGSLTQALPAKVTAMAVDAAGAAADHSRLYLGFANGALGWFTLPCKAHPADCTAYRYTTTDGTLRLPTWDAGFGANVKALDAVTCTARNFSASSYVSVRTRTDPAGSWTALGDNFDSGQREKIEFAAASSATILDTEITLTNTADTESPEVTGFGLHAQVQSPYRQVFWVHVLASDGLVRRDGTPFRLGPRRVREVVETAADTPGSVVLILPEGRSVRVRVKGVEKGVAWDHAAKRTREAFALECVQVQTNVVYGTHDRMEALGSHDALEARTHSQLEAL